MKIQHGTEVRDATASEIEAYESAVESGNLANEVAARIQQSKLSAVAKLAALGFSEAEIKALVG